MIGGVVANAQEAVRAGSRTILDARMPERDGLDVTRRPNGRPDPPRIVIVTTLDLDEHVHAALHGGASGFLPKDATPALMVEAARRGPAHPSRARSRPRRRGRGAEPREAPARPTRPGAADPPRRTRRVTATLPLRQPGGCPYLFGQGKRGCVWSVRRAAWRCD
ncbi:response regulator transcription factor [Streptomyces sp. NPDC089795]|uniref:response regulator n=1 Tax=Streptomyces sp. NPDC089795 TaxID=3155297 RepID=UPI0034218BE2